MSFKLFSASDRLPDTIVSVTCVATAAFLACFVFSAASAAEIPLASKVFKWYYNPAGEPSWLEGRGRAWVEDAMDGWGACGIRFDYQGETDILPNSGDRVNVIGWDSTLARGMRGITRSIYLKGPRQVAIERDVAFSPGRREFRLHPRVLRKVMAHEVGHVVGLGHAGNCVDVMSFGRKCPDANPEELPVLPTDSDLEHCKNLYQQK